MRPIRRKVGRHRLTSGVLTLVASIWASTVAFAQDFDPSNLAPGDLALIQEMLESERSHVRRSLPVSEQVMTIVRTETQPRICRHFVLQSLAGDQQRGVGCRVGVGQWQLAAAIGAIAQAPVTAPPTVTAESTVAPRVTAVLRPIESEPEEPTAAPIVSSPEAWTGFPLPSRRPADETEQAQGAPAALDDAHAAPGAAPEPASAAVPAALATVPLPTSRPAGRSTGARPAPGFEVEGATLGEREAAVAEVPAPAVIEGESLAAEVAQGDTDLSVVQPAPERGDEPAPIEPPVPGQRP